MQTITSNILKKVLPQRPKEARKYDAGLLLVIGGSDFYTGSPALAGMAGFRAGVDMVRVLAPKRAADIIAGFSPNLASIGLYGKWLDKEDVPTLVAETQSAVSVAGSKVAVVVGGGLGRSQRVKQAIVEYIATLPSQLSPKVGRVVIDADAIHAVAESPDSIRNQGYVLTPHLYELSVLTSRNVSDLTCLTLAQRAKIVEQAARDLGAVLVLKGSKDIISNGDQTLVNETGTRFMTVGGTGDTLAGICGALLAGGAMPFEAAQAAAFINGRAGELASKKYGPSMLATDLIEEIPCVISL